MAEAGHRHLQWADMQSNARMAAAHVSLAVLTPQS